MSYNPSAVPPPEGEKPGFIKSLFIYMAGAHPGSFTRLPPSESSEFVKLGMTLLVPFGLAATAGSFTLYTLQDPDGKSLAKALMFGLLWAIAILVIDIAVMSQLVKSVPPEQSSGKHRLVEPETSKKKGSRRTLVVALVRVMVATTLGILMSHCLVLYIFKGRVEQQVNANRVPLIADVNNQYSRIDEKKAELEEAIKVKNVVNAEAFLQAYRELRGRAAPSGSETPSNDATLAGEVKRLDGEIVDLQTAYDKLWGGWDEDKQKILDGLEKTGRDITQAELLLQYEKEGRKVQTFEFITDEFKRLGIGPSGIQGDGPRAARIRALIETSRRKAGPERAELTRKTAQRDNEKKKLEDEIAIRREDRQKIQSKITDLAVGGADAAEVLAQKSRALLDGQIAKMQVEIDDLIKEREGKLAPFRSGRSDLLEQTGALHDLMLGKGDHSSGPSRQGLMLGLVVLVMVCFMLIDLTPLMMKMTKEPGLYERLRQRDKEQSLDPFVSDPPRMDRKGGPRDSRDTERSSHVPPHRRNR